MPVELPKLPYPRTALQPHLSADSLDLHHGHHHRGYVDKVNQLIEETEFAEMSLAEIVRHSQGSLFQAASQAWSHEFFWQCLHPRGGGDPTGPLADRIARSFGDVQRLREEFNATALTLPGSGWVWLVQHPGGALAVVGTRDAGTPLTGQSTPLLVCDLWEHAYYSDFQNDRNRYLQAFWALLNWDFVDTQLR